MEASFKKDGDNNKYRKNFYEKPVEDALVMSKTID